MKTRFLFMRWCLLLLLLLTSYLVSPAQTRIGKITVNRNSPDLQRYIRNNDADRVQNYIRDNEEVKKYFKDNITLLDPIEGIYSIEDKLKQWNDYTSPVVSTQIYYDAIVKEGDNRYTTVIGVPMIFERIGDSNVYNCSVGVEGPKGWTWLKTRVVLENGILFDYTIDLPISTKDSRFGNKAQSFYTCIKAFPTASMYNEAVAQQTKPSEWSGTGFALMDGYVVTNHHVVKDAASISVIGVKGEDTKMNAKVVAVDSKNDLALLRINDSRFNGFGTIPYAVKDIIEDTGSDVFVLGYPLTQYMGDEIKLTNGIISSKSGYQGDITTYQISAPVQPGNSGGPMFDKNGNVIGIVNAGIPDAENVGYAIKTSYLYNLVSSEVSSTILPKNNTISGLSLSEKVKKLKNFTFMITCSSKASNLSSTFSNSNTTSAPSTNNTTSSSSSSTAASKSSSSSTTYGTNVTVINNPSVAQNYDAKAMKVDKVVLNDSYTAVQFIWNNDNYASCSIDKNTYILVNGQRYTMTRAEGINVAPAQTYFSYIGEGLTFTLYFPAIPSNATTMDLIERDDSPWRFYGINIAADNNTSSQVVQVVSESTGYINGYGYVDLGLSVKWATCNIGAFLPSDYGNYYAWGETSSKSSYTSDNSITYGKNMGSIAGSSQYDVARANWGGTWRLPTASEIDELVNKCKHEWTTQGGHKGYKITGPNGNSIFLPAAGWRRGTSLYYAGEHGFYWSASPGLDSADDACYLGFYGGGFFRGGDYRSDGRSVRPVAE